MAEEFCQEEITFFSYIVLFSRSHRLSACLNSRVCTVCRNRRHIWQKLWSYVWQDCIALYRSTVPEILHQLALELSKIIETVKVHDAVVPLCMRYSVSIRPVASSRFTIALSFRRAPLIGNMLRLLSMIRYSRELVQLHIAPDDIFIFSLVFFFSLQLCSVRVCMS